MKKTGLILTFLLLTFYMGSYAQKTAFINEGKLLKAAPGYEQAIAQMDTLKSQMQKELQTAQSLLSTKLNNLVSPYNFTKETTVEQLVDKLSEGDKKKFVLLQEESQLLDKQTKAKEEEYNEAYQNKVGPILIKVNALVCYFIYTF
jgi:Skp family chaperone for outer membrane proteins